MRKHYMAELRTYSEGEYTDWECFDGFHAENEEDDNFYGADYYINEAVDGCNEIVEMMMSGRIEDFQVRIVDEDDKEVSIAWASELHPEICRSKT